MFVYEKDNRLNVNFEPGNLPKDKPDVQLWKDVFGTHLKIGDKVYGDYPNIKKVTNEDYFYEIEINEYDEEYANKFVDKLVKTFKGGCSSLRKGNFFGRNYDWYYSDQISWLIKVPAKEGRFASIGMASTPITKAQVESGNYYDEFKLIPFQTLDGINENKVVCSMNVTSADYGDTTGTNPKGKLLYNIFACRYVLDNAKTAKHAVDLLRERNIKEVVYDGEAIELHYLIADETSNYIVEFKNNKMVVLSDQNDEFENIPNNNVIMTNFHLSGVTTNANGKVYTPLDVTQDPTHSPMIVNHIVPLGSGLERYNLAVSQYSGLTTYAKVKSLMEDLKYTNSYSTSDDVADPFWFTEIVGAHANDGKILTVGTPSTEFSNAVSIAGAAYTNRNRLVPYQGIKTWQTVHSSIYDIANKSVKIRVQEQNTEHEFSL